MTAEDTTWMVVGWGTVYGSTIWHQVVKRPGGGHKAACGRSFIDDDSIMDYRARPGFGSPAGRLCKRPICQRELEP